MWYHWLNVFSYNRIVSWWSQKMTTPPNPSLELFLEVHGEDVKTVKSTLHSQIALFVLKFCERLESFKVHLVRKQNETASISCNEIDFEGFKGFHLELVEYGALSPEIKQCSLPSFRVKGHFMIHSGLCGVLRQIVKHAYDVSKDERVVALLVSICQFWFQHSHPTSETIFESKEKSWLSYCWIIN